MARRATVIIMAMMSLVPQSETLPALAHRPPYLGHIMALMVKFFSQA